MTITNQRATVTLSDITKSKMEITEGKVKIAFEVANAKQQNLGALHRIILGDSISTLTFEGEGGVELHGITKPKMVTDGDKNAIRIQVEVTDVLSQIEYLGTLHFMIYTGDITFVTIESGQYEIQATQDEETSGSEPQAAEAHPADLPSAHYVTEAPGPGDGSKPLYHIVEYEDGEVTFCDQAAPDVGTRTKIRVADAVGASADLNVCDGCWKGFYFDLESGRENGPDPAGTG